jgi:uncharacterized membrane protein YhaH (DUF805 family)
MSLSKYFEFEGVVNRTQYWSIFVISLLLYIGVVFVGAFALAAVYMILGLPMKDFEGPAKLVYVPLFVVLAWVWLATGVKRCRDIDIHPLWLLAVVIPWVSFFAFILFGVLPTKQKS